MFGNGRPSSRLYVSINFRWITELEVVKQDGENIVMTLQNAWAKEPTVVIIDAGEKRKKKT